MGKSKPETLKRKAAPVADEKGRSKRQRAGNDTVPIVLATGKRAITRAVNKSTPAKAPAKAPAPAPAPAPAKSKRKARDSSAVKDSSKRGATASRTTTETPASQRQAKRRRSQSHLQEPLIADIQEDSGDEDLLPVSRSSDGEWFVGKYVWAKVGKDPHWPGIICATEGNKYVVEMLSCPWYAEQKGQGAVLKCQSQSYLVDAVRKPRLQTVVVSKKKSKKAPKSVETSSIVHPTESHLVILNASQLAKYTTDTMCKYSDQALKHPGVQQTTLDTAIRELESRRDDVLRPYRQEAIVRQVRESQEVITTTEVAEVIEEVEIHSLTPEEQEKAHRVLNTPSKNRALRTSASTQSKYSRQNVLKAMKKIVPTLVKIHNREIPSTYWQALEAPSRKERILRKQNVGIGPIPRELVESIILKSLKKNFTVDEMNHVMYPESVIRITMLIENCGYKEAEAMMVEPHDNLDDSLEN